MASQPDYTLINAIQRTVAVLERLAPLREGLSVTELAESMGINKATIFRILATLESTGYVEQEPLSQRYRLTLKIIPLAFTLMDSIGLEDIYNDKMAKLAREVGELVQFSVVQGEDAIFIAKAEGNKRIKLSSLLGIRAALNASTVGKLWLASLPEKDAIRIALAHGLNRYTDRTITTIDDLREEWNVVRQCGYATTEGEYWDEVNAVGAPVCVGRSRRVVGALSVAGPADRLPVERMQDLAPQLMQVAAEIAAVWPRWSEDLGYLPQS